MNLDYQCKYCGEKFDSYLASLSHEKECTENPKNKMAQIAVEKCVDDKPKNKRSTCLKRMTSSIYRRAFSETQLLDLVTEKMQDGESYHFITGGGCRRFVIFKNCPSATRS